MADDVQTFAKASPEAAEFIKKDADAYLAAQLTVALAGNQRAMTFFGFLATASAVLGGASVSALLSASVQTAYGIIGLCVVAGLLTAMSYVTLAASPDAFDYVGNTPKSWLSDLAGGKPFALSRAEALADTATCIATNRVTLQRSANFTKRAMWTAWGSILAGALLAMIAFGATTP